MEPTLTCPGCGTNLRLRATTLRYIKEIQCTKCRQTVPIPPELRQSDPAPQPAAQPTPQPAPQPAAASAVTTGVGTITFACSGCGKKTSLLKSFAGKKVKCPACQCVNSVPEYSAEKKADAPAPATAASATPPPPVALAPPSIAATPSASPVVTTPPPTVPTPHPAPPPGAAEQELIRCKKEVRAFLQEELRQARQRVTDLERRIDALV